MFWLNRQIWGSKIVGSMKYLKLLSKRINPFNFSVAPYYQTLQVIYDKLSGRSRGFGFVTMSTTDEVEIKAQKFNGYVRFHIHSHKYMVLGCPIGNIQINQSLESLSYWILSLRLYCYFSMLLPLGFLFCYHFIVFGFHSGISGESVESKFRKSTFQEGDFII